MGNRENKFIGLSAATAMFEFIISLITINSTENKVFWVFRIISSLLILVLSFFLFDESNNPCRGRAEPLLAVLPFIIIIFIVSELSNLIIYLNGSFSQSENYLYISHLIILILYYLIFKKMFK